MEPGTCSSIHLFLAHLSIFGDIVGETTVSLHMKNTVSQSLTSGENHPNTYLLKKKTRIGAGKHAYLR